MIIKIITCVSHSKEISPSDRDCNTPHIIFNYFNFFCYHHLKGIPGHVGSRGAHGPPGAQVSKQLSLASYKYMGRTEAEGM